MLDALRGNRRIPSHYAGPTANSLTLDPGSVGIVWGTTRGIRGVGQTEKTTFFATWIVWTFLAAKVSLTDPLKIRTLKLPLGCLY